jgi:hypothetical protein
MIISCCNQSHAVSPASNFTGTVGAGPELEIILKKSGPKL